jgi:hypothetical protein
MSMRITRTNSGVDSKGVVRFGRWEIDGEAYLFVVAGAVGTVLCFLLGHALSFGLRCLFSSLPLLAAIAWIRFFVVGRPPHFLGDWIEGWLVGPDFNLRPQAWASRRHPRLSAGAERRPC